MNAGHLVAGLLASGMAWLTLVVTQGMSGNESAESLLLGYGGGWFLLFGLAAGLPALLSKKTRKSAFAAFVAFGAGGGIAGGLIAALQVRHELGGSHMAIMRDSAIALAVPWILGAVFMSVLAPNRSRGL